MNHPAAGPGGSIAGGAAASPHGSPQPTAGYQSYYQIVQTPQWVMIMTEMIHDAREIPLDRGLHLSSAVQQWLGDSRGHWEGDTLVVNTTNYKPRAFKVGVQ